MFGEFFFPWQSVIPNIAYQPKSASKESFKQSANYEITPGFIKFKLLAVYVTKMFFFQV